MCIYIYTVYIYIYTYTSNTAFKITIHKVPKPHPTKNPPYDRCVVPFHHWMPLFFVATATAFLPHAKAVPDAPKRRPSQQKHTATKGDEEYRRTVRKLAWGSSSHRRFLFRYFGGFHSWHLQWTAGLLPNRSSTPHGPKKKGTQLRFFLLIGPPLEKKMAFSILKATPVFVFHPSFLLRKKTQLSTPFSVENLSAMRPMRRI